MQAVTILVFLVLPVVVAAVGGLALSALLREAFAPSQKSPPVASRLPLLESGSLRRWAADLSKSLVEKYASRPWTLARAAAAARDIEAEASVIIDRISPSFEPAYRARCLDGGTEPVFVTVPEVAAIAEELRTKTPGFELQRVMKRAHASAAAGSSGCTRLCPLLGDDGRCIVFGSRPLQCRGWSSANGAPTAGAESNASPAFSRTVSDGMREGLSAALTASGLDGRAIELDHALAQALDEADFVDGWARGEAIASS
jgi:hypothetical protein